jgi:hypothetical protein
MLALSDWGAGRLAAASAASLGAAVILPLPRVATTIRDDEPERMPLRRPQEGLEGNADSSRQATP